MYINVYIYIYIYIYVYHIGTHARFDNGGCAFFEDIFFDDTTANVADG